MVFNSFFAARCGTGENASNSLTSARSNDDDPHCRIMFERFKSRAQLRTLLDGYEVERRPVENNVRPRIILDKFNAETVEVDRQIQG